MAEIKPSDIGLATYEDVGEVKKLRTAAKNIVGAINELYQSGGSITNVLGEQLYIDGEDNVVIGENNVVYGKGNLVIGSNNIIVGENLAFVTDGIVKDHIPYDELSYDWFDVYSNTMWYYYWGEEEFVPPFKVGDKVAIEVCRNWTTENWDDYVSVYSGLQICEIIGIDESSGWFTIDGFSMQTEPPDDIHIMEDYSYPAAFVVLNDEHKLVGTSGCISFGGTATGGKAMAAGAGRADGNYSFAACSATATGAYAAAFGLSQATKNSSFSANSGRSYGEYGTALNYAYNYSPYSTAIGYYSRVVGRPLKATALNTTSRYLTIDSTYSLSGISEGTKILMRCYNSANSFVFSEQTVKSVSGNTIYLDSSAYMGGSGSYAYKLFPDGLVFVCDSSTSYANASQTGGYYTIASGKYTNANGYHTIAAGEGANIWGKYGTITEPYSLALANGTAHKSHGLAFKVLSDGSVHADAEYTTPCADYAEYFEWEDGNPNSEDRVGYFVKLNGEKIVKCGEFEKPLGIVSAKPAIIGDSGEMHWKGKYLTDDFGRVQYHDVVVSAEYDDEYNLISEEHIERQPVLNPDWDSTEEYVPRKNRPEWSPVGVLGKLVVYDDGTLKSGDLCRPGTDGIAVKSIENGYPVLKRVSEDKILVWFKE